MAGKSKNAKKGTGQIPQPGGAGSYPETDESLWKEDIEEDLEIEGFDDFNEFDEEEYMEGPAHIAGMSRDLTGRGTPGGRISDLAKGPEGNLGTTAGRGGKGQRQIPGGGASPESVRPKK